MSNNDEISHAHFIRFEMTKRNTMSFRQNDSDPDSYRYWKSDEKSQLKIFVF